MRMRSIWIIGVTLALTQLLNMAVMSWTYGRITYDHYVAGGATAIVLLTVISIRWNQNKIFYAIFLTTLLISAALGSALPDKAGINTALLPYLTLGPVLNGFMAGRRAALICGVLTAILFTFLLWVSLNSPSMMASGDHFRDINRYSQSMFGLTMATVISVLLSERIYSALHEAEENAKRAKKAEAVKSEFLATMSHELRTPLNGIIGLTDALLHEKLTDNQTHLTRTIRHSGESLLTILNDLLDLSKIEAGKLHIEPRSFDVRSLVLSTADSWRATAETKGLKVAVEISDRVPQCLFGDDLRIGQILQNLLSNAIKFTSAGTICLSVTAEDAESGTHNLFFRVRDTGKGIPEDHVASIFNPFEQGEKGTTRTFGGTGLGLSICRNLAELMQGQIQIEETSANGTTFLLTLPLRATTQTKEVRTEKSDNAILSGMRVLVADDNPVNRLVMEKLLGQWGVICVLAEDGPICLEIARSTEFDVILMDKHMPGMNGMEVTRRIRQSDGPCANIPIIAVTADAMAGEREAMLAAGMTDFMAKPVRAEIVKSVLLNNLKADRSAA